MTIISLLIYLVVIGVILWLINTYGSQIMDVKIIKIINVVVVLIVILWLLNVFGVLGPLSAPVPRAR